MSFLGGFARSLQQGLVKDQDADRAMSREQQMAELRKKYEDELVNPSMTKVEGEEEVFFNSRGKELYRRQLSANELAENKAKLDKVSAEGRRAVAEADVSVKNAGNYDEDRRLGLEDKAAQRAIQREQLGISRGHLGVAQRGLDIRERESKEAKADQVTATLLEAGDLGDVSAMALSEQYDLELQAAETEAERQKVIAKYLGTARNRLMKAKQANALELRQAGGSGAGLYLPAPPTLPGN
jgi:hypothetical protein